MAGVKSASYLELLTTGKYSDFVIACGGVQFNVHRAIVCPDSPMLDLACSRGFREATEGKIELEDEEPDIVARAILYLYTRDYDAATVPSFNIHHHQQQQQQQQIPSPSEDHDTSDDNSDDGDSHLIECLKVNALVYKCADKLGLCALQHLASRRFLSRVKDALERPGFAEVLKITFDNTRVDDTLLRRKLTSLCVENYARLDNREEEIKVLQLHEPNVWEVAVPLLKSMLQTQVDVDDLLLQFSRTHVVEASCTRHRGQRVFTQPRILYDSSTKTLRCTGCIHSDPG